jgi:Transcription termination factor nusG
VWTIKPAMTPMVASVSITRLARQSDVARAVALHNSEAPTRGPTVKDTSQRFLIYKRRSMWTVAQTKPSQLGLALTNLARQGYHTSRPSIEKRKLDRRRKLITVNEPLFLNYLFIELLDGQRWPPINSTYGVNNINKLLTRMATGSEYLEPASIADTFVEQLQSCSTVNDKEEWRLDPGTTVRIARGAACPPGSGLIERCPRAWDERKTIEEQSRGRASAIRSKGDQLQRTP